MAKKKSMVGSIGAAITDAASAVAGAANRNVVQPVGKALGLTDKKPKNKTAKKVKAATTVRAAAKKVVAKKPAAKKKAAAKKK
ncbi:MAG TPA: hypothetical protein VM597_17300 [Gemmataceae bacterium]|jgi:hypothetical protein|nr:hypothetical protein [Gemmataceae bacterium]